MQFKFKLINFAIFMNKKTTTKNAVASQYLKLNFSHSVDFLRKHPNLAPST